MKKSALVTFTVIAIVASFAAAAMPSGDPPPQLGFLFAFRNAECSEGSACQGEFETTLLVIDGDKMRVVVNTPHLYLPRKSGFWEVGTTLPKTVSSVQPHADAQASDEETPEVGASDKPILQLWAAPLGVKPTFRELSAKEESNPQEEAEDELLRLSISWVGPDYLSVTEQIGEYTTSPVILPIDGIARNASENPWKPKAPDAVLRKDLESCMDEKSDFNTREFLEDADQAWSISRGRMRWEFAWSFSHSGRALRGYGAACSTSLRPPKELVGSDALGAGWNQVLARVPDARTAFASPNHSLVLIFTNTQILALKREGNALSVPFARVFLTPGEIVSGQWAVGKYADAWAEQLSHTTSWADKLESTDKR